ncbi:hypothetical protein BDN72DRAFT_865587 [Pluteus cervinus]|uniref:Uncharacterized protein n=1 Tax=Pluteus cervinus TaxID=181527 RepID=A0ACD3A0J5_9AGAR|nr:hypothetical protein BDN72DRAFT_865587 [Pluteus cervinus]
MKVSLILFVLVVVVTMWVKHAIKDIEDRLWECAIDFLQGWVGRVDMSGIRHCFRLCLVDFLWTSAGIEPRTLIHTRCIHTQGLYKSVKPNHGRCRLRLRFQSVFSTISDFFLCQQRFQDLSFWQPTTFVFPTLYAQLFVTILALCFVPSSLTTIIKALRFEFSVFFPPPLTTINKTIRFESSAFCASLLLTTITNASPAYSARHPSNPTQMKAALILFVLVVVVIMWAKHAMKDIEDRLWECAIDFLSAWVGRHDLSLVRRRFRRCLVDFLWTSAIAALVVAGFFLQLTFDIIRHNRMA